jgi:hypothetical protein
MIEYERVPLDEAANGELVRATCFICEVLAGNPDYPYRCADGPVDLIERGWNAYDELVRVDS